MKKTLILLFVLLPFSLLINAQGNLEYNKVKLVTINGSYPYQYQYDQVFTVPAGKVWKIESAIVGYYQYGSPTMYLDNQLIYQTGLANKIFPIWLPSGSYTLSLFCVSCNGSSGPGNLKGSISAIEYNEVP